MTAPVGTAQTDIARFRTAVIPTNGDTTTLLKLLESQEVRRALASKAFEVRLDLPSQFLEKADLFGERTANRLALALSQTSRLHSAWRIASDAPDGGGQQELESLVLAALEQIKEAETAIGEAFNALTADGRASFR
ncbi:hypothetical protein [uncultured Stenotrophomonas sp.]|uniref:hypothetical protein n=1 Tax=uncultured Stenotrophomonas sp. TaxID=165438 RepID=UPI00258366D7|nr:hypothetical protein [uncultured Stenotrophomonas sp.]